MQKNKKLLIGIAAVIITLIAIDLSPFGGNLRYYSKWVSCGRKPVEVASMPGIAWYQEAPPYQIIRTQVWYCTPLEAEQAGYSASSTEWSFPHLHPKS